MNKEEIIAKCIQVLGSEAGEARADILLESALSFVNSYTFQSYSFGKMPQEIDCCLIDLVVFKHQQKSGLTGERLSDLSFTYSTESMPSSVKIILDKYRIINVV